MNEQKVSFIICTNNETYLRECQLYIRELTLPDGFGINILPVRGASSMAEGYNTAMLQSDAKYKVYLHQDVFILNKNFLLESLAILQENPKIGMLGMVGTKRLPDNGCMWASKMRTGALRSHSLSTVDDYFDIPVSPNRSHTPVQAIDGLLIMTQYDILWRSDLFTGWDFYDISQSMEFARAGYRIAVPRQETPWVLHDSGFMNLKQYHVYRKIFLQEYFPDRKEEIADCEHRIEKGQESPDIRQETAHLLSLLDDKDFDRAYLFAQEKLKDCQNDEAFCILSLLLNIYQAEQAQGNPTIFLPLQSKPAGWLTEHYQKIRLYLWRIDNRLPVALQQEGTEYFNHWNISKSALEKIKDFVILRDPLVSVIVVSHNQSKALCAALDSILAQTWRRLEIILVDDASDDDTFQVIEQLYGSLDNLIYIVNEEEQGIAASRNIGAAYAGGEYIAFLDADMIWTPDKLEKQVKTLSDLSCDGNAVYCSYAAIKEDSAKEFPAEDVPMECRSGRNLYPYSLTRQIIDVNTLLLRREVFQGLGGFSPKLCALQDYEFSIRLTQYERVEYIPELLVITYSNEEGRNKFSDTEEIITQCSIIEAHYDTLLQSGLVEKKLNDVYQKVVPEERNTYFECLSVIDRKEVQDFCRTKRDASDTSNHPQQITGSNIAQVRECVGCMACYAICKTGAIKPEYNQEGFLYPKIDAQACTGCGKCIEVCPLCNRIDGVENPKNCFALMASDEIRQKCSSGGVFPVLADYILSQGGYVSGVVWTENFTAKHIVSNKKEDVENMYSSKYLQSDMSEVYSRIKELLINRETVLFSGCACQVAALHTFLGQKEYRNLITVDVVCHGVPSPEVFRNWLAEQPEVQSISFRDKASLGWNSGFCANYADGSKCVERNMDNPYIFAFLNNWILRKSCYDCHFKKQKYSDITLGDFWGINNYAKFDDGLGTSFVTQNTGKGRLLLRKVQERWKTMATIQTSAAVRFNPCIEHSVKPTRFRQQFFDNWNRKSLEQTLHETKKKIHFDVALVLMWSQNYGNALTNYALYTHLTKEGYRVLALDNYSTLRPIGIMGKFAEKTYELSSQYFRDRDCRALNDSCDCFIVGSDQNWNYGYQLWGKYGNYCYLDFVQEGKKKLSYGTSFGQPSASIPAEKGIPLFQRFDAISVREEFGVSLCREKYGIEAQKVVDPVFLLSREEYENLASHSNREEEEPFIMVYILDPTERKRKLCLKLQEQLGGIKLINILDCNPLNEDYNRIVMEFDHIRCRLPLENWLYYMQHCQYVITDSFHGTCFSMMFQKPFVTVKNRENSRFTTFEGYDAIKKRIINEDSEWYLDEWTKEIDYTSAWKQISGEIEESKLYLQKHLADVDKSLS